MVAKAGSTPRKSGYTPVKLAYNHNGKTVTRKVLVQNGMKLAFDGSNKAEQGKYTVGNDGTVRNEKGDVIGTINTTVDQVAALEGMSRGYPEEGTNSHTFILSDADINAAMTDEGRNNSSRNVNMRSNALGAKKKTHYSDNHPDTQASPMNGVYSTRMTTDDRLSSSSVTVSSNRTEAEGKKNQKRVWQHQHPILNWFNENIGTSFGP